MAKTIERIYKDLGKPKATSLYASGGIATFKSFANDYNSRTAPYVFEGGSTWFRTAPCFASTSSYFLSKGDSLYFVAVNGNQENIPGINIIRILKDLCNFVNSIEDGMFTMRYDKVRGYDSLIFVYFDFKDVQDYEYGAGRRTVRYRVTNIIARILRLFSHEYFFQGNHLYEGYKFTGRKYITSIRDLLMCWAYGSLKSRGHNIVNFIELDMSKVAGKMGQSKLYSWKQVSIRKSYRASRKDVLDRIDLFLDILKSLISKKEIGKYRWWRHVDKYGISNFFRHVAGDYIDANGIYNVSFSRCLSVCEEYNNKHAEEFYKEHNDAEISTGDTYYLDAELGRTDRVLLSQ